MKNIIWVFVGGGFGSLCRYGVSMIFPPERYAFPMATLLVNIFGSLMIGLLMGALLKTSVEQEQWKLLWVTGFCGGFTTFSAFSKESFLLVQQQQYAMLFLYIGISILACVAAVACGFFISK